MFHLKNKKGVKFIKIKKKPKQPILERKLLQRINFENKLHSIKRV